MYKLCKRVVAGKKKKDTHLVDHRAHSLKTTKKEILFQKSNLMRKICSFDDKSNMTTKLYNYNSQCYTFIELYNYALSDRCSYFANSSTLAFKSRHFSIVFNMITRVRGWYCQRDMPNDRTGSPLSGSTWRYLRRHRIIIRWKWTIANNSLYGSSKVMMLMALTLRNRGRIEAKRRGGREGVTSRKMLQWTHARDDKKTRFAIIGEMTMQITSSSPSSSQIRHGTM